MKANIQTFHILTGGPGSGKSTLLEALIRLGCTGIGEAGRAVIRQQRSIGGNGLPWADRGEFSRLMFHHDLQAYRRARRHTGPVFFDRGIPDIIGYLRLCGLAVPARLARAARRYRYSSTVFILPPWPAIYTQDAERKQDLATAEATYRMMWDTYRACGYTPIPVPRLRVEDRARFVLDRATADFPRRAT